MSQTEKKNSLWRSGNLLKTTVTLSARATFVRHLVALTGGHRHVTLRNIRHNHRHTNNIDADYGNIMMMLTLVDVFVFEGVAVMMAFVILVKYYSTIITITFLIANSSRFLSFYTLSLCLWTSLKFSLMICLRVSYKTYIF